VSSWLHWHCHRTYGIDIVTGHTTLNSLMTSLTSSPDIRHWIVSKCVATFIQKPLYNISYVTISLTAKCYWIYDYLKKTTTKPRRTQTKEQHFFLYLNQIHLFIVLFTKHWTYLEYTTITLLHKCQSFVISIHTPAISKTKQNIERLHTTKLDWTCLLAHLWR